MKFLNSFKYAVKGILAAFKSERNLKIQLAVAVTTIFFGFVLHISEVEWIAIVICIGLVFMAEMFNTSFEKVLNFIHKEDNDEIGVIKDISAGAVLLTATSSLIVALIIFIPKLVRLWM
jgi:diacylglycerol kinase